MRFVLLSLCLVPLFSQLSFADPVPAEHKVHCRKWKDGKCVEGALTDLAKSIRNSETVSAATNPSTCDRVCKEACPNCSKCSLCTFCWFYSDDACNGVAYFKDRETCTEGKTESCCDLCDAHCSETGACSDGEYCNGGDKTTSTIVKCLEQTKGEICEPCKK